MMHRPAAVHSLLLLAIGVSAAAAAATSTGTGTPAAAAAAALPLPAQPPVVHGVPAAAAGSAGGAESAPATWDVVVYGSTPAGVAAATAAGHLGLKVAL